MRHTCYVTYYEREKRRLLSDCLFPVVLHIHHRYGLKVNYLQRHWKYGPHVRIHVRTEEPETWGQIRSYLESAIRTYLKRYPSTSHLDREKYLEQSIRLGIEELDNGPYEPLRPDNSIVFEREAGNATVLGGAQQQTLKDELMTLTMPSVYQLLVRTRDEKSRRNAYVLQLMCMFSNRLPEVGIRRGYLSFQSHLEEFLFQFDRTGDIRTLFERKSQETVHEAAESIGSVLQSSKNGKYAGSDPVLQAWAVCLEKLWTRMESAAKSRIITESADHLANVAGQVGEEAKRKWEFATREVSPFHHSLKKLNYLPERIHTESFSIYRWSVNLLYLLLPLAGITPMDRYYLCYLFTKAVEMRFGYSWEEIFSEYEQKSWGEDDEA
ncbi:lantibiotic dehydratase C-terminal domain-containing protein [Paenibacillus dendritiformis]|uniref:lantibiotic dehydratase C-terminal domain-containing protein n=1 Tax=Paenibacillus dendritiformis TaxID=130049 RepID=UPI00364691B3